ncbi:DgyrCDS13174 [Dimorphilus gyrociliatus]|uniref:DgyrCDS13174 n=1 Tax=Dimorphilus gyrociliatus TaxID=2664684 RepID=A0A7I8W9W9_9ANNE|nr:DgyrCDS13174 [Dimorphilus gyrociliatus]
MNIPFQIFDCPGGLIKVKVLPMKNNKWVDLIKLQTFTFASNERLFVENIDEGTCDEEKVIVRRATETSDSIGSPSPNYQAMLKSWRLADVKFQKCNDSFIHVLTNLSDNPYNDSAVCIYRKRTKKPHLAVTLKFHRPISREERTNFLDILRCRLDKTCLKECKTTKSISKSCKRLEAYSTVDEKIMQISCSGAEFDKNDRLRDWTKNVSECVTLNDLRPEVSLELLLEIKEKSLWEKNIILFFTIAILVTVCLTAIIVSFVCIKCRQKGYYSAKKMHSVPNDYQTRPKSYGNPVSDTIITEGEIDPNSSNGVQDSGWVVPFENKKLADTKL